MMLVVHRTLSAMPPYVLCSRVAGPASHPGQHLTRPVSPLPGRSTHRGKIPDPISLVSARPTMGCGQERVPSHVASDPDGLFSRDKRFEQQYRHPAHKQ